MLDAYACVSINVMPFLQSLKALLPGPHCIIVKRISVVNSKVHCVLFFWTFIMSFLLLPILSGIIVVGDNIELFYYVHKRRTARNILSVTLLDPDGYQSGLNGLSE